MAATARNRYPFPSATRCPAHGGPKWVPMTSTSVPAYSSRRRRRVADDCARSVSGSREPVRLRELDRVVGEVTRDERVRTTRLHVHGDVARRVARRELEADLVGDAMVGRDEVGEAGVDHGPHRVVEGCRVPDGSCFRPVRPLVAAQEVARVRERRHPRAVDQHGVPPHMVEVEVRADDGVDLLAREPGLREIVEEGRLQVERLHARDLPVVADAGVDDDLAVAHRHPERVDREHQVAVVVDEMGTQPRRVPCDHRVVGARQEPGCGKVRHALDDTRDGDVADLPLQVVAHRCCSPRREPTSGSGASIIAPVAPPRWAERGGDHERQRALSASMSLGTTLCTSPTTPRSAMPKIGASPSLLTQTMLSEPFMPTMCWVAPEMPSAM